MREGQPFRLARFFTPLRPRITWHYEGKRCCWGSHERRFQISFNPRNREDFKEFERIILHDSCDDSTQGFRTVAEAKLAAGRRVSNEWRVFEAPLPP